MFGQPRTREYEAGKHSYPSTRKIEKWVFANFRKCKQLDAVVLGVKNFGRVSANFKLSALSSIFCLNLGPIYHLLLNLY